MSQSPADPTFSQDIIIELVKAAHRALNALPDSADDGAALGGVFREVFLRIDFNAKVVEVTDGGIPFSENAVNFMIIALRFGLYWAARGFEIEQKYLVEPTEESAGSDRRDH